MNNQVRDKVGELRPSQILYSFGVGAVIDLPNISVMVMGLDDWDNQPLTPISEERLLRSVRKVLGNQVNQLNQAPVPIASSADNGLQTGIPVAPFPGWVVCPYCRLLAPLNKDIFTLKTDFYRPDKTRYEHTGCQYSGRKRPTVVPTRFLVACRKGHLDDFPWRYFVHGGNSECKGYLKLEESGVSGTAGDVWIKCNGCDKARPLSDAFGEAAIESMPYCRGRHPHLRKFQEERCTEQMKAILLGASNSWFPVSLSTLSIPLPSNKLTELVNANWASLKEDVTSLAELKATLRFAYKKGLLTDFYNYEMEAIWAEVEKKIKDEPIEDQFDKDLKVPEWQVFSVGNKENNTRDFQVQPTETPKQYQKYLEKVVLVEKLREVQALIGFTRIESPYDQEDSEEMPGRVALSGHSPKWVPASETRGEGIFISFSEEALTNWFANNPALAKYALKHQQATNKWRQARNLKEIEAPGVRYVLLHSFSHALMRQLSIECGYNAASLKERIYSKSPQDENGPMAGVLIYTAAPDSEGTLGGLVSLGRPDILGRHISQALEQMRLCASDPLCAEHDPLQGNVTLHGAACHSCLFTPETSCERGNKYLDRALLIPSVKVSDLAFFK